MTRTTIRDTLQAHLYRCESVISFWEAGSTALGRTDKYSDLDLGILYEPGTPRQVWMAVDQALGELGGVDLRWCEPPSVFRGEIGSSKRIFRLRGTEPWLLLDIRIFPASVTNLHDQRQRIGQIAIIFDRAGRLLKPSPWDEKANRERAGRALHQHLMKWQIYYGWFRKELARGSGLDAFMLFFHLAVVPLVTVLNIRYRLNRWDFGFRFLKNDWPAEIVKIVEDICYVPEPEMLEERFAAADRLMQTTVGELKEQGIVPIDPQGFDFSPGISNANKDSFDWR